MKTTVKRKGKKARGKTLKELARDATKAVKSKVRKVTGK